MSMNMDQMMMARMHAQNYSLDMQLAQYFQNISGVYTNMAQGEYQMYQYHSGQAQGMGQPMTGAGGQMMPGASGQMIPGSSGQMLPGSMGQPMPGSMGQTFPGSSGQSMPGSMGQMTPGM